MKTEKIKKAKKTKKSASKDLVASSGNLPAHLKPGRQRGMENASQEDLGIPRLVVVQPTSDEYLDLGYKRGTFAHSISKESFGREFNFIPLMLIKSRIKWGPEIGDPIECRSFNAIDGGTLSPTCNGCKHSRWSKNKKGENVKPDCTLFYNFPSIYLDENKQRKPIAISFKSTAVKAAKRLINLISSSEVDAFASWYHLTTLKEERKKGVSYNYVVSRGDYVEDPKLYKFCERQYEEMRNREVKIHHDVNEGTYDADSDEEGDVPF